MNQSREFELLLRLKRQQMTWAARARTANPKPLLMVYPLATEKQYGRDVSSYTKRFITVALSRMEPRLKSWLQRKDSRDDTYAEDLDRFVTEMEEEMLALYGASLIAGSDLQFQLRKIAGRILKHNEDQWQKQTTVVLGAAWTSSLDWWDPLQKDWELTNYLLVKKQAREFLDKTVLLIMSALYSKWPYDYLVERILKLSNVYTGYRAELLARDQVGLLNSQIWQAQYAEIGLPFYIWHTAMDERVRGNPAGKYPKAIPSHFTMEGLLMRWDNMSVYSVDRGVTWKPKSGMMEPLHVGMAIACRCYPLPYWNDMIAGVDSEIERLV